MKNLVRRRLRDKTSLFSVQIGAKDGFSKSVYSGRRWIYCIQPYGISTERKAPASVTIARIRTAMCVNLHSKALVRTSAATVSYPYRANAIAFKTQWALHSMGYQYRLGISNKHENQLFIIPAMVELASLSDLVLLSFCNIGLGDLLTQTREHYLPKVNESRTRRSRP